MSANQGEAPHATRPSGLKNGNRSGDPNSSPRCMARTRRGTSCQAPAMPNGRCRLHGGKSTGPRTAEGLERCRLANLQHGGSAEAIKNRREEAKFFNRVFDLLQERIRPLISSS